MILALVTCGLFIMTVWTGEISRTVYSTDEQYKTEPFQYTEDTPLSGIITIGVCPNMYESVPIPVWFNISIGILGHTPMNLTIDMIVIVLSPVDSLGGTDPILRKEVGTYYNTIEIVNITFFGIYGQMMITPVLIEGDVFLGASVSYHLINHSTTEPNAWSGADGSLLMIPVNVIPSIQRVEGWSYAFRTVVLVWCVLAAYGFKKKIEQGDW